MEAYRDSKFIAPLILTSALDLCSASRSDRRTIEKEPRYPMQMRLGGPQSLSTRFFFRRDTRISFAFAGIRTTYRPTCTSLVSILITLPRLRVPKSCFFKREHTFPACFIVCPITIEICVPPVQAMSLLAHRTRWCVFVLS